MKPVKVVYAQQMAAALLDHISPSSLKPKLLVEHLLERGYRLELSEPPALSREQLAVAHLRAYVDEVLDCAEPNGFGNRDPDIAATLPYTNGSMYLAAQLALQHGMAASFTSGFHHAHYDRGGGFCTFNGLMVTALLLHREQRVRRVMILDLDYHYGDGTQQIINLLGVDWIRHETFGRVFHDGETYLQALGRVDWSELDLVIYQAGADVHVEDPLGGVLTTKQMERRDRTVFETAHRVGVPIAWNLAGGYRRDAQGTIFQVLTLHEQTFRIASEVYGG